MSVDKSKRNTTAVAFADEAKRLAVDVVGFAKTLPGRDQSHIGLPLSHAATEMLRHVFVAKRIYVTDKGSLSRRRGHLNEALGDLDLVETLLEMAHDVLMKSYLSEASREQIERDRMTRDGMEQWYEGPYLEGSQTARPQPRKKRSRRPNPNFFRAFADRIRHVRALIIGVKKADSDRYRKQGRKSEAPPDVPRGGQMQLPSV